MADRRIARSLARPHSPWWRGGALGISRLSDGWLWVLAGLGLLAAGRRDAAAAALLAVALVSLAVVPLKRNFRRPRPAARPSPHPTPACRVHFPGDGFSFPSGHSMNAFAVAVVVARFCPHLAATTVALAAAVAASRVLLRLHFLSDVVAGSLLGALIGWASAHWMAR